MNDGAFPRQEKPFSFDLMAREKRPGDRSLRDEDRYLFLEALLSVRERLHISYAGQSIKDNTVLPPSVLVEELLDYLGTRFSGSTQDFPASIVTRHRLQPFSPAYFNGEAGFTGYSEHDYRAVRLRMEGTRPRLPFFSGPLPAPPEELRELAPADLLAFFDNPVRFLLRTRLGLRLDVQSPPLDDREPFELDTLDAFLVRSEVLALLLDGKPLAECRQVVKARGILPPARQGDLLFDGLAAEVAGLAERVRELSGGRPPEEGSQVDLEIDGFRISGPLPGICPERLLRYRCGKCSGRDMVRLWIEHLLLASLASDDLPEESVLVTLDTEVRLAPVADSVAILRGLLGYYWQGLTQPLKFFPRSSYAFAGTKELGKAVKVWSGDPFPERNNPYYALCFGDTDPLDDDFEAVSLAVFAPLLAHCGT
jgi:exodeoxyribonuclease V gamma subunit